jgi:Kef-type K+ transport system membrane component KefB
MTTADRPGETEAQRNDRNLAELLQELRVAAIGVQVIFGFLLSLPFYARFAALGHAQRVLYLVAVVLSAVSTALLLGPVAYHRLVFRRHQKHHLVLAANVMAIAGLAAVALTVAAAMLLVVSYVERGLPTVLVTIFTVCLFGGLWFVYPLIRRRDWPTAESAPSVPALADAEPPAAHLTPPADDGGHMRDVETASSADRE